MSKWLWWLAAKMTGPSRPARCSSPRTSSDRNSRMGGRIHDGRLTRRAARAGSDRLQDGNTNGFGRRRLGRLARLERRDEGVEIRDGRGGAEPRFVDRHFERVLDGDHQLDPLERAEAELVDGGVGRDRTPGSESLQKPRDATPLARAVLRRAARRATGAARVASASSFPRSAAALPRSTGRRRGSSDGPAAAGSPAARSASRSTPASATRTACTRSAELPVPATGAPTTADSRTPGIAFSTRSTSSGKTLSPSGVTIISFLRPRMCSRPSASSSPMSPVWNQPSVNACAGLLGRVEVAAGDVLTATRISPSSAIRISTPCNRFADRPCGAVQGMVQRDDGRRFGEAVALDHEKSEAAPERFQLRIEWRGADDERPELEAEHPVHAAIPPPPRGGMHPRLVPRIADRSQRRIPGDHVVAQHLEHLRHADHDRDAPGADLPDDVGRGQAAREDHHAGQHRRDERRHRLAEHVAERQQVQKTDRRERSRVPAVLRDLALDRDDVREDVPVGEDHPFRFRGRAGREDDLDDVVGIARDGGSAAPRRVRRSRIGHTGRDVSIAGTVSPMTIALASTMPAIRWTSSAGDR